MIPTLDSTTTHPESDRPLRTPLNLGLISRWRVGWLSHLSPFRKHQFESPHPTISHFPFNFLCSQARLQPNNNGQHDQQCAGRHSPKLQLSVTAPHFPSLMALRVALARAYTDGRLGTKRSVLPRALNQAFMWLTRFSLVVDREEVDRLRKRFMKLDKACYTPRL